MTRSRRSSLLSLAALALASCGGGGSDLGSDDPGTRAQALAADNVVLTGIGLQVLDPPLLDLQGCGTAPAGPGDLRKILIDDDGRNVKYTLEYGLFCKPPEGDYIGALLAFDTDLNIDTGCRLGDMGADLFINFVIRPDRTLDAELYSWPATCGEVGFPVDTRVTASLFIGAPGVLAPAGRTYLVGTIPRSIFPGSSVRINTAPDDLSAPATYTFHSTN